MLIILVSLVAIGLFGCLFAWMICTAGAKADRKLERLMKEELKRLARLKAEEKHP